MERTTNNALSTILISLGGLIVFVIALCYVDNRYNELKNKLNNSPKQAFEDKVAENSVFITKQILVMHEDARLDTIKISTLSNLPPPIYRIDSKLYFNGTCISENVAHVYFR